MKSILALPAALLAVAALFAAPAAAQQRESTPPPPGEAHAEGYLPTGAVDFAVVLSGPPAEGSLQESLDIAEVMTLQTDAPPERFAAASDDDAYVFPRFEAAFGRPINRQTSPRLVRLLNRVIEDVSEPTFDAKGRFKRIRPYQRYQLTRVCGVTTPPPPVEEPKDRSSYPSGHAAYGWAVAQVLARVAPERASGILARGEDYGLSRAVCGMHFPSDVEAGQLLATAVVTRLMTDAGFKADLKAARAEYVRNGRR